jgi:hypothetical protein
MCPVSGAAFELPAVLRFHHPSVFAKTSGSPSPPDSLR